MVSVIGIECCVSPTYPLLQDLQPNHQLYPACGVQFALLDAEEHREVGCRLGVVLLQLNDIFDVLVLVIRDTILFASQPPKDEACFCVATDFHQPSWRFWHEPDDDEETLNDDLSA